MFLGKGEILNNKVKYKTYLSSGANIVEQPLILVPGAPSIVTD